LWQLTNGRCTTPVNGLKADATKVIPVIREDESVNAVLKCSALAGKCGGLKVKHL